MTDLGVGGAGWRGRGRGRRRLHPPRRGEGSAAALWWDSRELAVGSGTTLLPLLAVAESRRRIEL